MNDPKTTGAALATLIVAIAAYFGFNVSAEVIGIISVVGTALVGFLAADNVSKSKLENMATPHGFVGAFDGRSLILVLPIILDKVGDWVKSKDPTKKGWQTVAGNLIKAFAPVVTAITTGSESGFKKSLRAVRDTITNYLGE